jgi:hypothetical protein
LRQVKPCDSDNSTRCAKLRGNAPGSAACDMSTWSSWTDCSHTCGAGQRFSSRRIITQARGTGAPCSGGMQQTLPCFLKACEVTGPADCKWGDWGPLSSCSASCGGGDRSRRRTIAQEASEGGATCAAADSLEVLPCRLSPCKDEFCGWSLWSRWIPCSASCGGGQTKRKRSLKWTKVGDWSTPKGNSNNPFGAANANIANALSQYEVSERRPGSMVTGGGQAWRGLARSHGPALCAFAALGFASMAFAAGFGIAHLGRCSQAASGDSSLRPAGDVPGYAAVSTEDPWEIHPDDVERPAFLRVL